MPNWCFQQLQFSEVSVPELNEIVDHFETTFRDGEQPFEPAGSMITRYVDPNGNTRMGTEFTEATQSANMTGLWKTRVVPAGVTPTNQQALLAVLNYSGMQPSDHTVPPFNPKYRRARSSTGSAPTASITWKSKWVPSYRDIELKRISAAFPDARLMYTCVERGNGFLVQGKLKGGEVVATSTDGVDPEAFTKRMLAVPSIKRLWDLSG